VAIFAKKNVIAAGTARRIGLPKKWNRNGLSREHTGHNNGTILASEKKLAKTESLSDNTSSKNISGGVGGVGWGNW